LIELTDSVGRLASSLCDELRAELPELLPGVLPEVDDPGADDPGVVDDPGVDDPGVDDPGVDPGLATPVDGSREVVIACTRPVISTFWFTYCDRLTVDVSGRRTYLSSSLAPAPAPDLLWVLPAELSGVPVFFISASSRMY